MNLFFLKVSPYRECIIFYNTTYKIYGLVVFITSPFSPLFSLVANLPDWFLQVGLFAAACANTPLPCVFPLCCTSWVFKFHQNRPPAPHAWSIRKWDLLRFTRSDVFQEDTRVVFAMFCTREKLNVFIIMMYLQSNSKPVLCLCPSVLYITTKCLEK